jgi:urease accessory protein
VDHLLAMLAVGILSGRMRGGAGLAIAAMFAGLLAIGIQVGHAGVELPFVEVLIGASVVACAAMACWPPRRLPVATTLLAGAFAFVHGLVHGQEAAAGVARLPYAAGLVTTSILLMGAGALLALALETRRGAART